MRILRVGLRLVGVRTVGQVFAAKGGLDVVAHCRNRVVCHADRVGSHVGDQAAGEIRDLDAAFIELLRQQHRLLHRKARGLLQLAGDEWGRGVALAFFRRDGRDDPRRRFQIGQHGLRLRLVADRDCVATLLQQLRFELWRLRAREPRENIPVLNGHEGVDFSLAVADQLQRHRLHASGGQTATHLIPQQRADLVADQAIEYAARALRVDHLRVDRAWMLERVLHRLFRDLVEREPMELAFLPLQLLNEVPANRFAFAIRVGRDVDV